MGPKSTGMGVDELATLLVASAAIKNDVRGKLIFSKGIFFDCGTFSWEYNFPFFFFPPLRVSILRAHLLVGFLFISSVYPCIVKIFPRLLKSPVSFIGSTFIRQVVTATFAKKKKSCLSSSFGLKI